MDQKKANHLKNVELTSCWCCAGAPPLGPCLPFLSREGGGRGGGGGGGGGTKREGGERETDSGSLQSVWE